MSAKSWPYCLAAVIQAFPCVKISIIYNFIESKFWIVVQVTYIFIAAPINYKVLLILWLKFMYIYGAWLAMHDSDLYRTGT